MRGRQKRTEADVQIPAREAVTQGSLVVPPNARGLVLFAHGSGSGRFSPRNRFVAQAFNKAGLATLLIDLLTPEEEEVDEVTREFRFNITLLARRLVAATRWLKENKATSKLTIGYFGASTGAAAALLAAAELGESIRAIVSRGGRPDLAREVLGHVRAPTLLIVGELDLSVIELNKHAYELLAAKKKALGIVPGASHLFEEPGALEEVARLATDWFKRHLSMVS